jgi:DNA processing protein
MSPDAASDRESDRMPEQASDMTTARTDDSSGAADPWIVLAHAVEPGDPSVAELLSQIGQEEFLARARAGRTGLRQGEGIAARLAGVEAAAARDRAEQVGARIVTRVDREWPSQLSALGERTPLALWVMGAADLRLAALRSVAMVGARACTAYGEEIARTWSMELVASGWTIVSGAAFGIDASSHRAALHAGGLTIAMVAGGVDVAYPVAHASLLAQIADQGLVVSEVPPGESVRRQRFLSRNRMIAALSRATVVVEAAERSGTSVTARAAWSLQRPVLAVPGPVTSPASAGCHRMVQEGMAVLVTACSDVLAAVDLESGGVPATSTPTPRDPRARRDALADREVRILDALPSRGSIDLAGLVRRSGLGTRDVLASASILVAQGWVEEGPLGWRRLRVPAAPTSSALRP